MAPTDIMNSGNIYDQSSSTTTIRVWNISQDTSEYDLSDIFQPYGSIKRVHIVLNKETKTSRGFAFIAFVRREDAVRAMEELQGYRHDYMIWRLDWAKPRARANKTKKPTAKGSRQTNTKANKNEKTIFSQQLNKPIKTNTPQQHWDSKLDKVVEGLATANRTDTEDAAAQSVATTITNSLSCLSLESSAASTACWPTTSVRIAPDAAAQGQVSSVTGSITTTHPPRRRESLQQQPKQKNKEGNNTIFISNISKDTTEYELEDIFQLFGRIVRVHVVKKKAQDELIVNQGFAFISFACHKDAVRALEEYQGHRHNHMIWRLDWAKPKQASVQKMKGRTSGRRKNKSNNNSKKYD